MYPNETKKKSFEFLSYSSKEINPSPLTREGLIQELLFHLISTTPHHLLNSPEDRKDLVNAAFDIAGAVVERLEQEE